MLWKHNVTHDRVDLPFTQDDIVWLVRAFDSSNDGYQVSEIRINDVGITYNFKTVYVGYNSVTSSGICIWT